MDATELAEMQKELGVRLCGLRPDQIANAKLVAEQNGSLVYNFVVTLEVHRWTVNESDGNGGQRQRPETEEEVLARLIP